MRYQAIDRRQTVREAYVASLVSAGLVTIDDAVKIASKRKDTLEMELTAAKAGGMRKSRVLGDVWTRYKGGRELDTPDAKTGIDRATVDELAKKLVTFPADFQPFPSLHPAPRGDHRQIKVAEEARGRLNFAENLAFASLLAKNTRVRLSGQDSARHLLAAPLRLLRRYATATPTRRFSTSDPVRGRSRCATARSPSMASWASTTATASTPRRRWSSGKRSSATSPTARR